LQGLYFLNPDKLPIKLNSFKKVLIELSSICDYYNISIYELALNFVNSNPNIDKIVIGVDNAIQLENNIEAIKNWKNNSEITEKINLLEIYNKELLNPSNW
jgi:predicted aldo/keto reductase-like oxidoreductase